MKHWEHYSSTGTCHSGHSENQSEDNVLQNKDLKQEKQEIIQYLYSKNVSTSKNYWLKFV